MDISTPLERDPPTLVRIPERPQAFWLRLAHLVTSRPEHASHRARVRFLEDFELVLQVEGSAWVWVEDANGSVDVHAGQLVFLPPGFRHGWGHEAGTHLAVHFDLHANPSLKALEMIRSLERVVERRALGRQPSFRLAKHGPVVPLVTNLREPLEWRRRLEPLAELWSRRVHETLQAQWLVSETLGWALRALAADAAAEARTPDLPPAADPRVLAVLRALDDPQGPQRPSVEDLAARAGLGLTAFRDRFRSATGRSPRRYLEERRIERAARLLLETDRSVYAVARAEGYEDPYHFSRAFKRVTGLSPRAYRKKARR
ncbi:MAG: AraC family transcriptional regulator [Planctomycetota bacterium]|nr:AraC family transcriptional regulator [Planctomycetota bacterium]